MKHTQLSQKTAPKPSAGCAGKGDHESTKEGESTEGRKRNRDGQDKQDGWDRKQDLFILSIVSIPVQ
jgi:hypothetical protein